MRIIIISDLHNRVWWVDEFLSVFSEKDDKIVFLGDYFDDYGDDPDIAINSAKWLKNSLKKPNRIHLCGTHDLWYRFPYNSFIEVSGNTVYKERVINEIMSISDWNKLKLFQFEQNFLISHAGVHINLISDYINKNKAIFRQHLVKKNLHLDTNQIIEKIIQPATNQALKDIEIGHDNPWLMAGFSRGGMQPTGGIIWLDWDQEFKPIPGLNQIVGHTEHLHPLEKITVNSKNYDLDTRNRHVGILEDGNLIWIDNPYIFARN